MLLQQLQKHMFFKVFLGFPIPKCAGADCMQVVCKLGVGLCDLFQYQVS